MNWFAVIETLIGVVAGAGLVFFLQNRRDDKQRKREAESANQKRSNDELGWLLATYSALAGQLNIVGQIESQVLVGYEDGNVLSALHGSRWGEAIGFLHCPCAKLAFLVQGTTANLVNEIQVHENLMMDMVHVLTSRNSLKFDLELRAGMSADGQALIDVHDLESRKRLLLLVGAMDNLVGHCSRRKSECQRLMREVADEVKSRAVEPWLDEMLSLSRVSQMPPYGTSPDSHYVVQAAGRSRAATPPSPAAQ